MILSYKFAGEESYNFGVSLGCIYVYPGIIFESPILEQIKGPDYNYWLSIDNLPDHTFGNVIGYSECTLCNESNISEDLDYLFKKLLYIFNNPKQNNPRLVYRLDKNYNTFYGIAYDLKKEPESEQANFGWKTVKDNKLVESNNHVFLEFNGLSSYEIFLNKLGLLKQNVLN